MPFVHLFHGFPPATPSNALLMDRACDHHIPSCSLEQSSSTGISTLLVLPSLEDNHSCAPGKFPLTHPKDPSLPALTTDIYAQSLPPATQQEIISHTALDAAISNNQPRVLFRPIPLAGRKPFTQQSAGKQWWQGEVRYRIVHVFANQIRQISIGDLIEFEADEVAGAQAEVIYSLVSRPPVPGYTGPGVCFVAAPWGLHQQVPDLEVIFFHPFESEVDRAALIAMHQPVPPPTPVPEPQMPSHVPESTTYCIVQIQKLLRRFRATKHTRPIITTFSFPFHHIRRVEEQK
jgi:hypothetical protein